MSGRGRGRGGGRGGGSGRGEYYKNKYGGGGGRHNGGGGRGNNHQQRKAVGNNGGSYSDLLSLLQSIDGSSYPAYHDIESISKGWHNAKHGFTLFISRAQSDPFARPTRVRVVVEPSMAGFPKLSYENKIRAVALGDYVHRAFYSLCLSMGADRSMAQENASGNGHGNGGGGGGGWSGPKGGDVSIAKPNQNVVEQSAVTINPITGEVTAQFTINLPARGRTILGQKAIDIMERVVPTFVQKSLVYSALHAAKLKNHVLCVEDQQWLRDQLYRQGLVGFVPNGAVLPRAAGDDDRPMVDSQANSVVRFESPKSVEMSFDLPNLNRTVVGMGIKTGITLIVGGGFHGKR